MLACEEVNDADAAFGSAAVVALADGETAAECVESDGYVVGVGDAGGVGEAETVDPAKREVEQGMGLGEIVRGEEEKRRLGGEVGRR